MKKRLFVSLALALAVMFGYAMQASACHIVDASITATCVKDGGQISIDYEIMASTYPAGQNVNYELTITGPSGVETEIGTFLADTGPNSGSVSVAGCGTYSITGYVEWPTHDTWNLTPVTVVCTCDMGEGCTPGYWKTKEHQDEWKFTGYHQGNDFDATFGIDLFDPDITLFQAVWAKGGGVNKLARHGTAALLSAAHPGVDYPLTVDEVIAAVKAGDADTLAAANELGCPID
jgi:hypothetical protein